MNGRVDAGQKAREPCGTDALHGQFRHAGPKAVRRATLRGRLQTNGQKEPRRGRKLTDAAAEKSSIVFEKNKMTPLYNRPNQILNPGTIHLLASSHPYPPPHP